MEEIIHQRESTCKTHGAYTEVGKAFTPLSERVFWFGCEHCKAEVREASARAKAESEYRRLLDIAGIPARYRAATLGNYDSASVNKQSFRIVSDYAKNCADAVKSGKCLIITGTVGTGKTHIAIGLVKAFALAGYGSRYITTTNLIHEYRACYSRDSGEREIDVISRYGKCALLVLDEVGMQRGTEDEQRIIHEVIDMRYNDVLPTVIVSNLSVEGVREMIGDRAIDRLREGGGLAVSFVGESHRKAVKS